MQNTYLSFCRWLDRLTRGLCVASLIALSLGLLAIVVLRFGFGAGSIKLQNLASYAFAIFLIFSLPACLAGDGHVRIDILSERLSQTYRRIADMVAVILLLIPVFGLLVWAYLPDLAYSWSIRETSLETGGLGGLYLIKTALPVAAILMILQGVALILRRGRTGS